MSDTPHDDRPMHRRFALRIVALSAPPLLLWLWLLVPMWQPAPVKVTGPIQQTEACLGLCQPVLSVGPVALSCQADLMGFPYACPPRLLQAGTGSATYFVFPSLGGLLGLAPTAGVLLELERDGQRVFRRSVRAQVFASIYGGWAFHAVYWPVVALIIWRWPNSRVSRRAQWLPTRP
jgi:hypothetical protein